MPFQFSLYFSRRVAQEKQRYRSNAGMSAYDGRDLGKDSGLDACLLLDHIAHSLCFFLTACMTDIEVSFLLIIAQCDKFIR